MKKIISMILICTMLLSFAQITALGVYTAPEVAETQFSEDFEAYQLINDYDSTRYWDVKNQKNSAYLGEIYNGIPADRNYTDTTVYPNGTASVYEGNLDDSGNTYVHDYTYKNATAANEGKITGGTVDIGEDDGWYGYTNSSAQQFNVSNRRLAVFNIAGASDVNKTQYAILQPRSASGATYSSLSRNNISINGYSYLTARVSLSSEYTPASGDKAAIDYKFTKAGVTVTKNPDKHTFSGEKELVYFVEDDEGKENVLDVMFNGARVAEVKNSRFAYDSKGTKTEYTGEWYTIQYRMWIDGDVKKHSLTLIDDTTKEVVYNSGWRTMYGDFEFDAETYGLRFYAQTSDSTSRTCMRLDDIKFHNGTFVEDFEGYNIKTSKNGTNDRIGNGPRGNRNAVSKYNSTDAEAVKIYENGVYEGNFAKNVFIHHVLKDNTVTYDTIFGGNFNWQGYVKVIKNINEVRYLRYSETWQYPCTVVSTSARHQDKLGFDSQALVLRANAAKSAKAQAVYAGMDYIDISDKTTISATFKIQQTKNNGESIAFQLTKGKDTGAATGADYAGTSHLAYYDVLQAKDGHFYFAGNEIGNYIVETSGVENDGAYRIEYTIDLTNSKNPTHEVKIFNNITNEIVAEASKTAMNLTEGATNFNFENGINGFRFIVDAPNYTSASDCSDIMVYIDDVKVSKTLPASFKDISDIKDATYSAETKKIILNADMEETHEAGNVVIFAVYDKQGETLKKLYKFDCPELVADKNELEFTINEEYDAENYFGKVFLWKDLTNLNPVTKCADVIFGQPTAE